MKRRFSLILVVVLVGALAGGHAAGASTSKAAFDWHAGDGFAGIESPDEAMADNGDVVVISATGTLDAGAKTATGGGTFVHMNGSTVIGSGTFSATKLLAFQFYGCGDGVTLPTDICGGRALIAVHLVGHLASDPSATVELDGNLEVNCQIGAPPPGTSEGVTLNVKDLINFHTHVEGETVFVQTS